jgi:hypothetical protein
MAEAWAVGMNIGEQMYDQGRLLLGHGLRVGRIKDLWWPQHSTFFKNEPQLLQVFDDSACYSIKKAVNNHPWSGENGGGCL